MEDCIFCKIVNEEIPSEKIYEDDELIAFKDINPVAPIHILIIPKKHISTLMEMKEEDMHIMENIMQAVQKIAKEQKIDVSGFRLIANCGPDSGQEIMHIHFHLLAGKKMGPKIIF